VVWSGFLGRKEGRLDWNHSMDGSGAIKDEWMMDGPVVSPYGLGWVGRGIVSGLLLGRSIGIFVLIIP